MDVVKTCISCGQEKKETEFNYKNKKKGRRNGRCKECTRRDIRQAYQNNREHYLQYRANYNKKLRADTLEYIYEYLLKHPCVDCGESNPIVLQFDHVRGKKKNAVSIMVGNRYSLNVIKEEIKKCDIRCANCHMIKTAKDWSHYTYLQKKLD